MINPIMRYSDHDLSIAWLHEIIIVKYVRAATTTAKMHQCDISKSNI